MSKDVWAFRGRKQTYQNMKKLFLILFGVIMTLQLNAFSVDSTITKTKEAVKTGITDIDTSSNFHAIYNDMKDGIVAMAKALKVGAEHVYYVLVKQQIVYSIVWTIVLLSSLFILMNALKAVKNNEIQENITLLGVIRVIQFMIGGIFFIVGIYHIDTIVTGFINPEYGAIQEIIKMVKSLH